jgi:hypothetical protein
MFGTSLCEVFAYVVAENEYANVVIAEESDIFAPGGG